MKRYISIMYAKEFDACKEYKMNLQKRMHRFHGLAKLTPLFSTVATLGMKIKTRQVDTLVIGHEIKGRLCWGCVGAVPYTLPR
jgi:hypothetical protein